MIADDSAPGVMLTDSTNYDGFKQTATDRKGVDLRDAPDIVDGYHEAGWRGLTGQSLRKTRCGSSAIG